MDILKMWPEHLAQVSAKDIWEGLSNIDAACSYTEDGEVFLFEGNGVGKYTDGQARVWLS
jgi:F0F1-type ATP synthase beta subunit